MTRSDCRPIAALLLAALAAPAPAAEPTPDPLRLVPPQAVFTLKVENPRKLADAVTALDAFQQAQALAPVREAYASTTARRFFQFVGYAEKQLGAKWPDLLDRVAGGGVAVGGTFGDKAPAVGVMQGTDETAVAAAYDLFFRVLEEEQARQGVPYKATAKDYAGVTVTKVGDDALYARVGAAVLVSNKDEAMKLALDLATGRATESVRDKPTVAAARTLLPPDPLAWFWLDFAKVKEGKEAKDFFESTRKDFAQTLVIGGTVDCLRQSDFITGGLFQDAGGFRLSVRMPGGSRGFPPEFALHAPPEGVAPSLPFLAPPGTLYTQSFYLDLATLWKERDKLINEQTRKDLEKAEKDISKFVPGVKFGQLLEMWGPYHRVLVVNQDKMPYKTEPAEKLPAFAFVTTMKDPQFGKSVEGLARGAGFLLSFQYGLKLTEATHAGAKVVGYRFPEDKPFPGDPGNARFNFEPCFAIVGDQMVFASTTELARKLVDELKRTDLKAAGGVWRAQTFIAPFADALAAYPDAVVTTAVLERGLTLAQARKEVDDFAAILRTLGTARIEVDQAKGYKLDVVWNPGK